MTALTTHNALGVTHTAIPFYVSPILSDTPKLTPREISKSLAQLLPAPPQVTMISVAVTVPCLPHCPPHHPSHHHPFLHQTCHCLPQHKYSHCYHPHQSLDAPVSSMIQQMILEHGVDYVKFLVAVGGGC